jgi:hypothetical protein
MLDQSAADPDGLDTLVRTAIMMVPDVQEPPTNIARETE